MISVYNIKIEMSNENNGKIFAINNHLQEISHIRGWMDRAQNDLTRFENGMYATLQLYEESKGDEEKEEDNMETVNKYRNEIKKVENMLIDLKFKMRSIQERVQDKCPHKETARTRGGNHCYGYEDRETYCVYCEKILY